MVITAIPQISVIIPLYNKRHTILRAINSVINQKYKEFEIIIVDDGSTDGSGDLVSILNDSRIRFFRQENAGPGNARNSGARQALSPLLAFLDADDEWLPDFLITAISALRDAPECIAYVCGYDSGIFRNQRPNKILELGKIQGRDALPNNLEGDKVKSYIDALHSSCTVVRQDIFEDLGGYYDKYRCLFGEDSFFWLLVLLNGPIYWDPIERVIFHVEDSDLGFAIKNRKTARPISTDFEYLFQKCPPHYTETLKRTISVFVTQDLNILIRSGAIAQAKNLREKHKINGRFSHIKDKLSYYKSFFKHTIKSSTRSSILFLRSIAPHSPRHDPN